MIVVVLLLEPVLFPRFPITTYAKRKWLSTCWQVIPTEERNTPREATWIDQPFVLSDEQLKEGEALLLRILQLTPASTEDDGSAFEPRWSTASTNSSVRDRVEV